MLSLECTQSQYLSLHKKIKEEKEEIWPFNLCLNDDRHSLYCDILICCQFCGVMGGKSYC